ncbi:MFS transporter [Streptosporangium sp. NPDC049376]|uniref:MFS transporter n=1 Tax=Streptosporangium sp. NPDC049376 TaxID=3366192 RepID=UPI0037A79FFD
MAASSTEDIGKTPPRSPEKGPRPGSWGDLFRRDHLAAALVLAGGVALYAMNLYLTAALMPSIVQEVGGERYYAWVATGFLMAAVIASMLVSRLLVSLGASGAYVLGFLVFAAGAALNALSPTMELLLVGRVVQGFGGGLLAGLGYAVIRGALPDRLWARAAGLVSAMWGVGTLVGPTLGGLFAQLGAWRWAFGLLAAVALVLAALARRALPGHTRSEADREAVPVLSLAVLTLAAAAFSVASTLPQGWGTLGGVAVGAVLVVAFVVVDRRGAATVLPRLTYLGGNGLKWIYLTVAVLCAGVMTENFIPLFGQRLGGLNPLVAGFLGAAVSAGWVVSQLFSVGITAERSKTLAVRCGSFLLPAGLLAYGFLQSADASGPLVALWAAVLVLAGVGIGVAYPHLSVAAMRSTDDEREGAKAAAALSTTQLIAYTVASALAGILLSLGGSSLVASARSMVLGLAVVTVLGTVTTALALRGSHGQR